MIAVALTIVVMYIQPKITTIRETQDLITNYETETQNVSQVNENLKTKISEIDTIAPQDTQALSRFLPDQVDEIAVLKDLSTILKAQELTQYDIAYKGNTSNKVAEEGVVPEYGAVSEYYFSATFDATYSQVKSLLSQLETNDYLLQVTNLKMTETTAGKLKVELSLTAFSRQAEIAQVTQ